MSWQYQFSPTIIDKNHWNHKKLLENLIVIFSNYYQNVRKDNRNKSTLKFCNNNWKRTYRLAVQILSSTFTKWNENKPFGKPIQNWNCRKKINIIKCNYGRQLGFPQYFAQYTWLYISQKYQKTNIKTIYHVSLGEKWQVK